MPTPDPPTESREGLELRKLRAEADVLDAKVVDLHKSKLSRPTFWFSVVTALVAVAGVVLQARFSDNKYTLASIKAEQAELDQRDAEAALARATLEKDEADRALSSLREELAAVRAELDKLDRILDAKTRGRATLDSELEDLEELRSSLSAVVTDAERRARTLAPTVRTSETSPSTAPPLEPAPPPLPPAPAESGVGATEPSPPIDETVKYRLTVDKLRIVKDCQGFSFLGIKGEYVYLFDAGGRRVASLDQARAREHDDNEEIVIDASAVITVDRDGETVVPIHASVAELDKSDEILKSVGRQALELTFVSGQLVTTIQPLIFEKGRSCRVELVYRVESLGS